MKKAIILLSLFAVQVSLFAQEYFPEGTRWKGSAVEVAIDGVNYFLNLKTHEAIIIPGNNCSGELDIPSEVSYNDETFTVKSIFVHSFYDNTELTKVRIPKTIETIEHTYPWDPDENPPTGMIDPIYMNPFWGCSALESIEVDEENSSFKSVDGVLFSQDGVWHYYYKTNSYSGTALFCYPEGAKQESYSIPEGVEWIGGDAFYHNSHLSSLTLPNSMNYICDEAFYGCSTLRDVYCHAENVPITEGYAFEDTPIASATLHVPAGSIEEYKATSPWSGFGNIVALPEEPHQPLPFLEGNPIWVYKYEHIPMDAVLEDDGWNSILCWLDTGDRLFTYYFLGDKKEIEGRVYTMMGEVTSNGEEELTVSRWLPVREENGIVYAITDSLPGLIEYDYLEPPYLQQGNESVLYNFSAEIGEKLYPRNEGTTVKSFGTYQLMDGTECRVLKTTDGAFDLYEKLGYLHDQLYYGVMDPPSEIVYPIAADVYVKHLNAYYQDKVMLYKAPDAPEGLFVNDTCWTREDAEAYAVAYKADPYHEKVMSFIRQLQGVAEPITFTEGQMATIILPTEPEASKGKYYRLDRVEDGKIIFEQELQPRAHVPYIIVPSEDFSIDLSTLDLAGCYRDTVSVDDVSFIGSYVSETFDYPDGFYIDFIDTTPDCRFDESCVIGALRAYLLVRWDDPYNQGGTRVPPLEKLEVVLHDNGTGINNINIKDNGYIYDLQGRKIAKPQKGINIIRYSDGTTRKVLVK